ncbi:MAG: molybdenum ABC transporter ATP-binding protein [Pseudomonadota bacterium]
MKEQQCIEARFEGGIGKLNLSVDFVAPSRGITGIFGPSGCGKTTVLRCIAGLHSARSGRFSIDGEIWQDEAVFLPAHQRSVGYVFQDTNLFDHMSVRANLTYGLRRAQPNPDREAIRLDEVVALLGISGLLERSPIRLSGGEKQRVAIGRALLSQPSLLLMDEPLAALDQRSKNEILPYLEQLRDRLSIPVLYISHDIVEIERLADQIVLMDAGHVVAQGTLAEIQSDPTLPIARMPEAGVALRAEVTGHDATYGLSTLSVDGVDILVPGNFGARGSKHRVRIAATDVSVALEPPKASSILNVIPSTISGFEALDPFQLILVLTLGPSASGVRVLARISRRSWDTLGLSKGQMVYAQIKSMALIASNAPP